MHSAAGLAPSGSQAHLLLLSVAACTHDLPAPCVSAPPCIVQASQAVLAALGELSKRDKERALGELVQVRGGGVRGVVGR